MDKAQLLNMVAFCVLMQNQEGIIGKSPDYILEKFDRYCMHADPLEYKWGLDASNQNKLSTWANRWLKEEVNFGE